MFRLYFLLLVCIWSCLPKVGIMGRVSIYRIYIYMAHELQNVVVIYGFDSRPSFEPRGAVRLASMPVLPSGLGKACVHGCDEIDT